MNRFVFSNFMVGELLDNVLAVTTELRVSPAVAAKLQLFSQGDGLEARLTLWDGQQAPEIVGCVANPQTGVLTVNRAQEGTTAVAWAAGTQVRCVLTADVINQALLASMDTQELLQANFLSLQGGTVTGPIILPNAAPTNALQAVNKGYVDSIQGNKLPLAGGTMAGSINMNGNRLLSLPEPVANTEPARLLDLATLTTLVNAINADRAGGILTSGTASAFAATTNQTITSLVDGLTVRVRFHEINNRAATLALNATPATPIQCTAGVPVSKGRLAQYIPIDLVYNQSLNAWLVVGQRPGFTTGDVKATFKTVADPGFLMMNDQTIGNTGSGASFADPAAYDLFVLLRNNISDTYAPVSGGRGANADADWSAGKTLQLTRTLGRSLAFAGAGSGLTSRALGFYHGEETHTLTIDEMPAHDHGGSTGSGPGSTGSTIVTQNNLDIAVKADVGTHTHTIPSQGGGQPFTQYPPTAYLNAMICL